MNNFIKNNDYLNKRKGLPKSLQDLLDKYPREVWDGNLNLGNWSQFWLGRHELLRELSSSLKYIVHQYKDGMISNNKFIELFPERFNLTLSQLHSHHSVEDNHIFPILYNKSGAFRYGFDLLESDHEIIHNTMDKSLALAKKLMNEIENKKNDKFKYTIESFSKENDFLIKLLHNHMIDEEDLIVPLVIDRGESIFGLGH